MGEQGGSTPGSFEPSPSLAPSLTCPPLSRASTKLGVPVTVATGLLKNGWVSSPSTKGVCMAVPSPSNSLDLWRHHQPRGWVPGRKNKAVKISRDGGEAQALGSLRPRGVGGWREENGAGATQKPLPFTILGPWGPFLRPHSDGGARWPGRQDSLVGPELSFRQGRGTQEEVEPVWQLALVAKGEHHFWLTACQFLREQQC